MYQIYQILPGENLETIAGKFSTNADNLISINGLTNPINLVPGNYLVVPKMESPYFYQYTVKKGDNLCAISRSVGIDMNTLETINGLENGAYIYPNQQLLIPREGFSVYITEEESLEQISRKSGVPINELLQLNKQLLVVPEQIVVYKVNKNE